VVRLLLNQPVEVDEWNQRPFPEPTCVKAHIAKDLPDDGDHDVEKPPKTDKKKKKPKSAPVGGRAPEVLPKDEDSEPPSPDQDTVKAIHGGGVGENTDGKPALKSALKSSNFTFTHDKPENGATDDVEARNPRDFPPRGPVSESYSPWKDGLGPKGPGYEPLTKAPKGNLPEDPKGKDGVKGLIAYLERHSDSRITSGSTLQIRATFIFTGIPLGDTNADQESGSASTSFPSRARDPPSRGPERLEEQGSRLETRTTLQFLGRTGILNSVATVTLRGAGGVPTYMRGDSELVADSTSVEGEEPVFPVPRPTFVPGEELEQLGLLGWSFVRPQASSGRARGGQSEGTETLQEFRLRLIQGGMYAWGTETARDLHEGDFILVPLGGDLADNLLASSRTWLRPTLIPHEDDLFLIAPCDRDSPPESATTRRRVAAGE
jgi:hypothetical protein